MKIEKVWSMKLWSLVVLALLCLASAGTSEEPKHSFAIYLIAEPAPGSNTQFTNEWLHVELYKSPIISDADIISYDWSHHSLKLRPEVFKRLPHTPVSGVPFIVVADGQRIYWGLFTTMLSSIAYEVPSVMVDIQKLVTNAPPDVLVIAPPYTPGSSSHVAPDPRSDTRIKEALLRLDKLKETP